MARVIDQPVLGQTAAEHQLAAEQLIKDTGYHRRLPELAYLKNTVNPQKNAVNI